LPILSQNRQNGKQQQKLHTQSSNNMVSMTTSYYPRLLFLFLSCFLNSVLANGRQECKACVSTDGCTYCRGDKFFEDPSVCVCNDLGSGFFGGCSDYSFGSKPLDSKLDCAFNTQLSWLVVIAILVGAGIFFGSIYCCYIKSGKRTSSSSGGRIPEPTTTSNNNTTTTATNTTTFQNHYPTATAFATTYHPEPGASATPFAVAVPCTNETNPSAYNPSYACAEPDINVGGGGGGGTKTSVVDSMMSDLNSSYP
jgi:hypothetical protein